MVASRRKNANAFRDQEEEIFIDTDNGTQLMEKVTKKEFVKESKYHDQFFSSSSVLTSVGSCTSS